jgi:hypothetical protein
LLRDQVAVDGDWVRYGGEILDTRFDDGTFPDPRGKPSVWRKSDSLQRMPPDGSVQKPGPDRSLVYSPGPNGVDERGGGDDLFAALASSLWKSILGRFFIYPRECFVGSRQSEGSVQRRPMGVSGGA